MTVFIYVTMTMQNLLSKSHDFELTEMCLMLPPWFGIKGARYYDRLILHP